MRKRNLISLISITIIAIVSAMIICGAVSTGSIKFLTCSGKSMEPTITSADVLVVTRVNPRTLKVGDIIVYEYNEHKMEERTVTINHRIVEITEEGFKTKGDAIGAIDDYTVKPSDIVGVVKFKIPYLGSFLRFANTTPGFVLLIIIPATLIIAIEIKNIIGYRA